MFRSAITPVKSITDGSPPLDALPAVLERFTGRIVGGAGGRLGYAERIPCRHRVTFIGARPTGFLRCSSGNTHKLLKMRGRSNRRIFIVGGGRAGHADFVCE